jgi:hypothetical protein
MERALAPTIPQKPPSETAGLYRRTKTPPPASKPKPKPVLIASTPRPGRPTTTNITPDYDGKIKLFCSNDAGRDALAIARHLSGPKATTILPIKINPILYRLQKTGDLVFTQPKANVPPIWRAPRKPDN